MVANIFLATSKIADQEFSRFKPKVWFYYIDNTFIIWIYGRKTLQLFYDHVNSHNDTEITKETKSNNSLPFLYVPVARLPNGHFDH